MTKPKTPREPHAEDLLTTSDVAPAACAGRRRRCSWGLLVSGDQSWDAQIARVAAFNAWHRTPEVQERIQREQPSITELGQWWQYERDQHRAMHPWIDDVDAS